MKGKFFGRKIKKQRRPLNLKSGYKVLGGKENKLYKNPTEFSQKETQEEWIDLMGIPRK